MPETCAAAPANAGCPRCGAAFHCGAREATCECSRIELDAATLARLRADYGSHCLCNTCLRSLQAPGATAASGRATRPPERDRRRSTS